MSATTPSPAGGTDLVVVNGGAYFLDQPARFILEARGLFESDYHTPYALMSLVAYLKHELPRASCVVLDTSIRYSPLDEVERLTRDAVAAPPSPARATLWLACQRRLSRWVVERQAAVLAELRRELQTLRPRLVALPMSYSSELPRSVALLRFVRRALPHATIITGGIVASICATELMQEHPELDILIRREAEIPLARIVATTGRPSAAELRAIPGICFRDGSRIVRTPDAPMLRDLDALPPFVRAYDEFDMDKRIALTACMPWISSRPQNTIFRHRYNPAEFILTSRGCPFDCSYCASKTLAGRAMRYHSIGYLHDVLQLMKKRFDAQAVAASDAVFTIDGRRIKEMARVLGPLGLRWHCQTRLDCLDRELIGDLQALGMESVAVGIETTNPSSVDGHKDNAQGERIAPIAALLREHGIASVGTFIVGLPGDGVGDIIRNALAARRSGLDHACFFPLVAVVGSDLYQRFLREVPPERRAAVRRGAPEYLYTARFSKPQLLFLARLSTSIFAGSVARDVRALVAELVGLYGRQAYYQLPEELVDWVSSLRNAKLAPRAAR